MSASITLNITDGRVVAVGTSGPAGPPNSISVGTVTTGAPGSSASATITGTAPAQSLNLAIPRGDTGATGSTGATGAKGDKGDTGDTGAPGDWSTAQVLNAQTGTSYSLVVGDVGKLVTFDNASAVTLTVGTGLGITAGQRIDLLQIGAGQITVGGSATINGTPTLKLRTQYSAATLICVAPNSYVLVGDLAVS